MINRYIATARVGSDISLKTTTTGKDVADFRAAIQTGKDQTLWLTVKVWGQSAKYVSEFGAKGRLVAIDGRLEQRSYQNSQGQQVTVIEVIADRVELIDKPQEGSQSRPASTAQPTPVTSNDLFEDDDPFAE